MTFEQFEMWNGILLALTIAMVAIPVVSIGAIEAWFKACDFVDWIRS